MSDVAIKVENLSKLYRIGLKERRHETLVGALTSLLSQPVSNFRQLRRLTQFSPADGNGRDTIWALKDVSFEAKHGEVVGLIGRNGAGKSTLLKIISRITRPTSGRVTLNGRVASLLEVGTGFHPELTGRENVYLNGTVLGMNKHEVDRKFDEIVAFAEVEKFIDTPVKRYSSGMGVRLAFAVAAHLEPEILLVDEVLAVGDAAFQKKCLGKMGDVVREGRTVLFVSHNTAAVKKLCERALLLAGGQMKRFGNIDEVVDQYESEILGSQEDLSHLFPIVNHQYGLALENVKAQVVRERTHAHLLIEVQLKSLDRLSRVGIGIWVYTYDGFPIAKLEPSLTNNIVEEMNGTGTFLLEGENIEQYLASGEYNISITITLQNLERLIFAEKVAKFQVPVFDVYGSGVPFRSVQHGISPLQIKLTNGQP
jgi:lipopolysaccharide transport system ATP-binding protein